MLKRIADAPPRRPRRPRSTPVPDYIRAGDAATQPLLASTVTLPTFWRTTGTLTLGERKTIVEQALVLIGENYVHLPLKRSMHATDPVQALKLLKYRLNAMSPTSMDSEAAFHAELLRIFASVRDLHTNYVLPAPYNNKTAFLPFLVEEYIDAGLRRYVVSAVFGGFAHGTFVKGVEITSWNGVPIDRAVEVNGDRNAGSNRAARHARGLEYLALRPLAVGLPPDEAWVEVAYVDLTGAARTLRFNWLVFEPDPAPAAPMADEARRTLGIDVAMDLATRAKRVLYAPHVIAARAARPALTQQPAAADTEVPTAMGDYFRARSVTTASGDEVGHLRVFSFNVEDPAAFVSEASRLISLLPQGMLILDVRGNGGGHIYAGEGLLQLFTPRQIAPEPTQFVVSPLNRKICERHRGNGLGAWLPSLDEASLTGAVYSAGHPITPPAFANAWGQTYRGRVLCVTDARCYSATDIFAAGFQDHRIGPILGVDDNTGAGGANVWENALLAHLMADPVPPDPASPYRNLPKGAGMRVAIRRSLRVHHRAGTPLEDLGVQPDERHLMTRNDLLNDNVDLLEHAAQILASRPLYALDLQPGAGSNGVRPVTVTTANVDRVDVYVDGRPFLSRDLTTPILDVGVPEGSRARFEGWAADVLVISNQL